MKRPHLNRALTLEAPQRVSDGAGGFVESWVPLGMLWAEVTARTGRETAQSGAAVSRMAYKIIVRGAPQGGLERPTAQQRFRDGARIFTIQAVTEADHAGRYLTCFAQEETAV